MNKSKKWEFILLYPNTLEEVQVLQAPLGVMFCYKNQQNSYIPSLVGIDYRYNDKYQTYRQLLYQSVLAATDQNFKTLDFGISASFEKKKLGATLIPMHGFIQTDDNFYLDRLEAMN